MNKNILKKDLREVCSKFFGKSFEIGPHDHSDNAPILTNISRYIATNSAPPYSACPPNNSGFDFQQTKEEEIVVFILWCVDAREKSSILKFNVIIGTRCACNQKIKELQANADYKVHDVVTSISLKELHAADSTGMKFLSVRMIKIKYKIFKKETSTKSLKKFEINVPYVGCLQDSPLHVQPSLELQIPVSLLEFSSFSCRIELWLRNFQMCVIPMRFFLKPVAQESSTQ
ncbi:hypothetical protein HELRODRAFT_181080 [Helobdella robusta]|uniref:Uncharacterized protein n=1 Tax=Helobdella robusta TaxID=6412 RepID=T1FGL4_HELRO|nr:hypothetical protein HELRODRAFT_181080 [Helobdella robusta]ESN93334.1 hypothetical protein HELRODRAFT_181080 [Helobdella robusta]